MYKILATTVTEFSVSHSQFIYILFHHSLHQVVTVVSDLSSCLSSFLVAWKLSVKDFRMLVHEVSSRLQVTKEENHVYLTHL